MSNEFDLEWAKRGCIVLYQINLGYGIGLHQEMMMLVNGHFFKVAEICRYGNKLKKITPIETAFTEENFRRKVGRFSYPNKYFCESVGLEYIAPPVDVEALQKRIDELERSIKNLHKVKGRYHTQLALESLFKLVGLENNIGEHNGSER